MASMRPTNPFGICLGLCYNAGRGASVADRNRRWVVLLAGVAIVAVVLLAAGLSELELAPGQAPARLQSPSETGGGEGRAVRQGLVELLGIVLAILTVLLVGFLAIYLIISADAKKRMLLALGLLAWLLVLYLVSQNNPPPPEEAQATVVAATPTLPLSATPLPTGAALTTIELDLHPPAWLVWLGAVALAALAAGAVTGIAWLVWSQRQQRLAPLEQLAQEAERALSALEAGAGLDDTIMRCYVEMGQILKTERGIVRQEAMTPREFARGLRGTGLPEEAVAQLTRLFENVRYGTGLPGQREERQAMTCLAAIAEACRSTP
jgi:hypothetical protein